MLLITKDWMSILKTTIHLWIVADGITMNGMREAVPLCLQRESRIFIRGGGIQCSCASNGVRWISASRL